MTVFYCGYANYFIKDVNKFLVNEIFFLHHNFPCLIFVLCFIVSHNSHMFLYLNGTNPCIEHLDMFWNLWNLILWRESGKKIPSCSDDSKSGALIPGQSEQHFKIQYHFIIFDPINGEVKGYNDASSQALQFMYTLFENIWFFYSMKYILYICKSLFDI